MLLETLGDLRWIDLNGDGIFGFRTYDAGGGDVSIGNTFYNFNDWRHLGPHRAPT